MQKKKIGIVISGESYVRNYLRTEIFNSLKESYDLTLILPKKLDFLRDDNKLEGFSFSYYDYPSFLHKRARLANEISLFANIGICKDFAYRVKRKYNYSSNLRGAIEPKTPLIVKIKIYIKKNLLQILAIKLIKQFINKFITTQFAKYSPLQKIFIHSKLDFVICPSSAAGTEEFDVCAFASLSTPDTKTILIIDNWDNLSSKYVMSHLPSHVIVWGEQTRMHGMAIQKIPSHKITALGTPRFSLYSKNNSFKNKESKASYKTPNLPSKYILFCGAQTYFDENIVIERFYNVMKSILPDYEIVYRPHPWRENFGKKIPLPKNVILDPTLSFDSEKINGFPLPNLELYEFIMSNSKLIVGGCTSMIIEASLIRKPYLLLAHNDGNLIQSPFEYFVNNEHQNLTPLLNNVSVCYSLEDLSINITELINRKVPQNDNVLDFIMHPEYGNYSSNLKKLIDNY